MTFLRPLIILLTASGGIASATVVNIDFNHDAPPVTPTFIGNGAGETAPPNNVWNSVVRTGTNVSAGSLLTSTGAASSVGISLSGISGSSSSLGEQELGGFQPLMQDYLFLDSGAAATVKTLSGSITGLTANGNYQIFFYAQGDNMVGTGPAGQNSLFTIGSDSKQTGYDVIAGIADGIEYVMFAVSADGTGKIDFTWANVVPGLPATGNVITDNAANTAGAGSRYAALNGIQIVSVVPEPSTLLLGALGLLGLLVRRR